MKRILNNRGSSIVMVLITMTFITILGAILMFASYTGFQVKVAQTRGEQSFYDAEVALDLIRAKVQAEAADYIVESYTALLSDYTNETDIEPVFQEEFGERFKASSNLFQKTAPLTYNGAFLDEALNSLGERRGEFVAVFNEEVEFDTANNTIILKGITVTHNSKYGYVSTITSDIAVAIPNFSYIRSAFTISGVLEYALIATEEMNVTMSADIAGSAYAGKVDSLAGRLNVIGGTLISKGDVTVNGEVNISDSSLWANRLIVKSGGVLTLDSTSETFLADDLVLDQNNAKAILAGHFYGYGISDSDGGKSSSILVNGLNCTLDTEELETLFIAGNSFITMQDSTPIVDILTGQSISVKADQAWYYVPESILNLNIPYTLNDGDPEPPTPIIDYDQTIWTINGVPKCLNDYITDIKKIYVRANINQQYIYYFLIFETKEKAGEYFRDYFSQNTTQVEEYFDRYLDDYIPAKNVKSSGYYYTYDAGGNLIIENFPDKSVFLASSQALEGMFGRLCRTLSSGVDSPASTDPYDYIVNTEAVNNLSENTTFFYDDDGVTPRAVIVKGDLNIDIIPDSVNFVLCTGNVTVNKDFNGLILSNGTVSINGKLTASPDLVISALGASDENGKKLAEYLDLPFTGDSGGESSSWAMSELVSYRNWRKE